MIFPSSFFPKKILVLRLVYSLAWFEKSQSIRTIALLILVTLFSPVTGWGQTVRVNDKLSDKSFIEQAIE